MTRNELLFRLRTLAEPDVAEGTEIALNLDGAEVTLRRCPTPKWEAYTNGVFFTDLHWPAGGRPHDATVQVFEPCNCPPCSQGLPWWRCENPRLVAAVFLWTSGVLTEDHPEIQRIRQAWPGKTLVY